MNSAVMAGTLTALRVCRKPRAASERVLEGEASMLRPKEKGGPGDRQGKEPHSTGSQRSRHCENRSEHGFPVPIPQNGGTPLLYAVRGNHVKCVEALLGE